MLEEIIWDIKNYYNGETNSYVHILDYEFSKVANEIIKIPKTVKNEVFIYRK